MNEYNKEDFDSEGWTKEFKRSCAFRSGNIAIFRKDVKRGYFIGIIIKAKEGEFLDPESEEIYPPGTEIPVVYFFDPTPIEDLKIYQVDLLQSIFTGMDLFAESKELAEELEAFFHEISTTRLLDVVMSSGEKRKIKLIEEKWREKWPKKIQVYPGKLPPESEWIYFRSAILTREEFKEESRAILADSLAQGPVYMPQGIIEYEEDVLSHNSFARFLKEMEFDEDIRKDIVAYKRERADIIEEYRFDREAIFDEQGREHKPNPKGMKRDLRATFVLAKIKKSNPVPIYEQEKFFVLGHLKDKKIPGSMYQRSRRDRIQLAELRYKRWQILPSGKKKLITIINSPYTRVELPRQKGDPTVVWINADYLESVNKKTWELEPGGFKQLPSFKNPYRGKFVEEKAYEWLAKNVKGRNLNIKAKTILINKLNTPKQYYQRLNSCFERIDRWLSVARQEGYCFVINPRGTGSLPLIRLLEENDLRRVKEILSTELEKKRMKLQDPTLLGDVRKWEIEFFSPIEAKFEITNEGTILTEEILKFLYDENDFGIRNPRDKSRAYLHYYLKIMGVEEVRGIYKEIKISPTLFSSVGNKQVNQATMLFNELALARDKIKKTKHGKRT